MAYHGIDDIGFYGLGSAGEVEELEAALATLRRLYPNHFIADMMCTFGKVFSFLDDPEFVRAVEANEVIGNEKSRIWRLHTLAWAARSAVKLPGDFVECGVFLGLSAAVVTSVLEFERAEKTFYLYDTFEGLSERYSSAGERETAPDEIFAAAGLGEAVVKRFEGYANVRVIKGVVPDILDEACPDDVAYLHLDMNAAKAEIGALEVLFDRMVPGGFLVLDDFAHSRHRNQFTEERAWFKAHGHEVLELPTGQGLLIKH